MSNKTQLQTNNTALDALIRRVKTAKYVVAFLPEAGGSGGVETCTVRLEPRSITTEQTIQVIASAYENNNIATVNKTQPFWFDRESGGGYVATFDIINNTPVTLIFSQEAPSSPSAITGNITVLYNNEKTISCIFTPDIDGECRIAF